MKLKDANTVDDLAAIYNENNLTNISSKIQYLKAAMKIRASRSDTEDTPEEELLGLEELAITHCWEGLH